MQTSRNINGSSTLLKQSDRQSNSPAEYTIIAELANAVEAQGYIPTASAYEAGDYEVFCSCYQQDAAAIFNPRITEEY